MTSMTSRYRFRPLRTTIENEQPSGHGAGGGVEGWVHDGGGPVRSQAEYGRRRGRPATAMIRLNVVCSTTSSSSGDNCNVHVSALDDVERR